MNNMLPPYFNMLKSNMPLVCDYYGLRNPKIYSWIYILTVDKLKSRSHRLGNLNT